MLNFRRKLALGVIALGLVVPPWILGSSPQKVLPAFEVVSIKPNNSGSDRMVIGGPGGCHGTDDNNQSGLALGRCLFKNVSTRELINDDIEPRVYGISDDSGRLMVLAIYNSDLGDAWEYRNLPCYPEKYSGAASF